MAKLSARGREKLLFLEPAILLKLLVRESESMVLKFPVPGMSVGGEVEDKESM
jgi:hypothetical protein